MKIAQFRNSFLALGGLALLAGPLLTTPAQAQDAAAPSAISTPISLDLRQVPVQAALTALFKSAGIRNFNIVGQPQGFVNLSVSEVPFSMALQQLLNSANPPLVADLQGGIYVIHTQPVAAPPPAPTVTPPPSVNTGMSSGRGPVDPNAPKRFYKIPIDKYDAYYIASLLEATSGVIPVGVNDVVASGGGQGGFGQGQQGGQGRQGQGGFGQGRQGSGFGGQNSGFGGQNNFGGGQNNFGGNRQGGFVGGGGYTGVGGLGGGGFAAPF